MSRYATTIEAGCEGDAMNDEMIMVSREPVHPGEFLREDYMPELGLTVATLAKRLGVSRQTVISLEKGKYNPSLALAFTLARYFNLSIEDIFDDSDDCPDAASPR